MFQSTHPQGCDSTAAGSATQARSFNPRTRKGATDRKALAAMGHMGFNPRTRKGATHAAGHRAPSPGFQSTHPQGCDLPPLNSLNRTPEKGDPREPPLEAMHWHEHA